MRSIVILLCTILVATTVRAQTKHEVRAVWLTTIGGIDWPHSYAQSGSSAKRQQNELRDILDRLQKAGINTVLLQTRIRSTVIYPSTIEPWDGCLSGHPGASPGYDALRFAIDECHARGMEIHAWVVTIPVGKWNSTGCSRLRKRHPGLVRRIGTEGYMNPEKTQTAKYLADICGEIAQNYDIDGIHLDYIRYPETWPIKVSRQQGRRNITEIVKAITDRVKAIKPWVKMSCSPVGKHDDLSRYHSQGWNAYTTVCQDAQGWLRDGFMDVLFPMMYFRGNHFYPFALDWEENSHDRIIAPGLGIYFMSPKEKDWPLEDITRELETLRCNGMGYAFFRSKFFTDNTKGIYEHTANRHNQWPALVPPMTWENASRPSAPTRLDRSASDKKVETLSWKPADYDTTMTQYNVYSERNYPVDTDDARNLVAVKLRRFHITVPQDPTRHYAVTAIDRYGNESEPLQETHSPEKRDTTFPLLNLLPCDGQTLHLPQKGNVLDADHIAIETVLGQLICMRSFDTATTNISNLPEGMYVLRSVGRKGVSHRLGHFVIRRKF